MERKGFLFFLFFFTIKENDVLKWEKVHQTLSGLLNRHRFSLIRVNFPASFFRRTKKEKCVVSVFLSTFDYPRAASCVCAVPLGRYEIRHGGDAQLKPPFNIHFHLVVFIFWFRRTCSSRWKGWSFHRLQCSDYCCRLYYFTCIVYTYCVYIYTVVCFHRSDGKDGGGDSSILLRWTNCALYIDSIWVVNPVRKKGRERKEEGIL
jgi:hypothetical protein